MYAGLKLFGVSGLILGPIVYILLRVLVIGMLNGKSFKEYFLIEEEL
jgi:predicted PurR-regulated permease PerM